jgi:trk system potassium uptake protein TrkH
MSFLFVILVGTILLSLPIFNKVQPLSFINNLFIATSATCVTGLMPVVVMDQFNIAGQIVLLVLIQIGGLGLMSFIALIVVISKQKLGMTNKKLLVDGLNRFNSVNIGAFLKHIFKFTIIFELIGALLIMIVLVPDSSSIGSGIFKSIFLSVSSFCNAGIDTISATSLLPYQNSILINFVVMILIICGGIGFTIWFDIKDNIKPLLKKEIRFKHFWNKLLLHTKVVLTVTAFLLVSGTVLIFIIESFNPTTLGNMSIPKRIMVSLFSSTTLRTAGFSTIEFGTLTRATKTLMLVFMLIGGSPGGTAGGLKTTTLFIVILYLRAQIKGLDHIKLYNKEIKNDAFKKAFTIIIVYIIAVFVSVIVLSITEGAAYLDIVFEVCSAIGTVGLSCGITSSLTTTGKVIIILLMIMGRVGPVTIVLSFTNSIKNRKANSVRYPKAELLVG